MKPIAVVFPAISATHATSTNSTAVVAEGAVAGQFLATSEDTSTDMAVSSLKHRGNPLLLLPTSTPGVPFDLFAADSLWSPVYGAEIKASAKLTAQVYNSHAANDYDCQLGFLALNGARRRMVGDKIRTGKHRRSSWLASGSTIASVGAGSTTDYTICTDADNILLDRLVIPRKAGLYVAGITFNGQPMISDPDTGAWPQFFTCDNPHNPSLLDIIGRPVNSNDALIVTVGNKTSGALNVAVAVTHL